MGVKNLFIASHRKWRSTSYLLALGKMSLRDAVSNNGDVLHLLSTKTTPVDLKAFLLLSLSSWAFFSHHIYLNMKLKMGEEMINDPPSYFDQIGIILDRGLWRTAISRQ